MTRWFRSLAVALATLAVAVTSPAPADAALSVLTQGGSEPLLVELHKGILVRLPSPAAAVFIADPAVADVNVRTPTLVYVTARRAGETTLFAVDDREVVVADVRIIVTHNLTRLHGLLREAMPGQPIRASSVAGGLLLNGAVADAAMVVDAQRLAGRFIAEGEQVINRLVISGPTQVNLRVRIAEVSRDVLKRYGFSFDVLQEIGDFSLALVSGTFPLGPNILSGTFTGANTQADAFVDALEEEGLLTLLAEPNLTALSGETASFLAGGEFPIPVPSSDGIGIEFKQFGVSLALTPTILGNDRISLNVVPEVSTLSSAGSIQIQGFVIPALATRRAATTVELASGQSLAIAGLLDNNIQQDFSELPGLADLPVIGALFRSTEFTRNETELVIIVTPYLVRPTSSVALAMPTDGFVAEDDVGRVIGGRFYQPQVPSTRQVSRGPGAEGLVGPGGFLLN